MIDLFNRSFKRYNELRCIFCQDENKRLTKEHAYPRWLKKILPYSGNRSWHYTRLDRNQWRAGKMDRPGDMFSQQLKVACGDCNGGWMSYLQDQARPILTSLILGDWPVLEIAEQELLSAWIIMFTMVAEYDHLDDVQIPQLQRTNFFENQKLCWQHKTRAKQVLSEEWNIAIGKFNSGGLHSGLKNHYGCLEVYAPPWNLLSTHRMQTTGFTIGRLFAQVFSSFPSHPFYQRFTAKYIQMNDLRVIRPFAERILIPPTLEHSRSEFDWLTHAPFATTG